MSDSWTRVVVGVDGSHDSKNALRWAAAEARSHDAELMVVTAYHSPAPPSDTGYKITWADDTDWHAEAEARLRTAVQEALGDDHGLRMQTLAAEGAPAGVLIKLSEQADLLVVGTRGHGGFVGMLLGSVSQHLIGHARCTVSVVR